VIEDVIKQNTFYNGHPKVQNYRFTLSKVITL